MKEVRNDLSDGGLKSNFESEAGSAPEPSNERRPSNEPNGGYNELLGRYLARGLLGVSVVLAPSQGAHGATLRSSLPTEGQVASQPFADHFRAVSSGLAEAQKNLTQRKLQMADWIKARWDKAIWRMFSWNKS